MKIKKKRIIGDPDGMKWMALNDYLYHSSMFNQDVQIKAGDKSDGATGAPDIDSDSWWIHDKLCETGTWKSGQRLSNFVASTVLGNMLWHEGYWYRSVYWWFATFFGGGGKAKENGLFRVKKHLRQ